MGFYRLFMVSLLCVFFVSMLSAQVATPQQHLLHDWSTRHVVFTGLTPETLPHAVRADPRAWHSWVEHARYRFERPREDGRDARLDHLRHHRQRKGLARDWNMPIAFNIAQWASPAKFGFNINATPDCTNDYVVFPTGIITVAGSSGPGVSASLVGYNNLYTGPGPTGICPTPGAPATQPSVLFAYNTATTINGEANLSPVLSLDGKKIAFVETNGSNYVAMHVLTWKAGEGTAWNSAAVPGDCSPGNSCMTTLVLQLQTPSFDSRSNPFVDYAHDIAYVGDASGQLHKITPVFNGAPQEVIGSGWPVQLASGSVFSPVYDSVSGRIFVTEVVPPATKTLYVIDAASGAIVTSHSFSFATVSDVIVDSSNQTVFLFAADASFNLTAAQLDTSGTLLRRIAVGVILGDLNVYTGAFDHNYFTSPSSGSLYFAGAVGGIASLYSVGFTGKTMNSSFLGPLQLTGGPFLSLPTPLTETFNPTFSNTPDRLFVGINGNCVFDPSGQGAGCIESFDLSHGFPSGILNSFGLATRAASNGISGIIIDNVSASDQASSIYFESALPLNTPPASAFKLTQSGLQ